MDKTTFFDRIRATGLFGATLSQSEVDGLNAILAAMQTAPLAWTSYALGTAYLETAHTMQPIHEMGGTAYFTRMYDPPPAGLRPKVAAQLGNIHPGDGAKYHGRGYVMLTGLANYMKAGAKLGQDLVGNPDLALRPDNAAVIMRDGMSEGWFTGARFASRLPAGGAANRGQFIDARGIINGRDRAEAIADFAMAFQNALS